MAKKEWSMEEFEKPKSKNVLGKTPKVAQETDNFIGGRISTYVGETRKQELITEAKKAGMSLSTLLRTKYLKKTND